MLGKTLAVATLLLTSTPAFAEDWGHFYAEIYGGAHLAGTATGNGINFQINAGPSYGAEFGLLTPVPGLSFGIDAMATNAGYATDPTFTLNTVTVMANAQYAIPVGDMFEIYGGAGLGAYYIAYNPPTGISSTGWGPGYQVELGARVHVTENVSIIGELKHQDSFGAITIDGTAGKFTEAYGTNSGVVGLRFALN